MAVPRTQLLRLSRMAFPSTSASTSAYNALSNPLPRRLVRCLVTEAVKSSNASAKPETPREKKQQQREYKMALEKTMHVPQINRKYGRVISAGRMDKTVRVEFVHEEYDKHIRRPFPAKSRLMVSDPNNSCREGDVIRFASGWRASKNVRHIVEQIVAPFGSSRSERWKVLSRKASMQAEVGKMAKGRKEVRVGKIKSRVLRRMEAENARLAVAQKAAEELLAKKAEAKKKKKFEAKANAKASQEGPDEWLNTEETSSVEVKQKIEAAKAADKAGQEEAEAAWKKEEMAILERHMQKK